MNKSKARKKIKAWVEKNPDGYLQKSMREIAFELGISYPMLDWLLYEVIAERDGCLPSEVFAKRKESGVTQQLTVDQITEIRQLHNEGVHPRDISYITKHAPATVKKYISHDE